MLPFKNIFHSTAYVIFGVFILYFFIYFLNYHYHIIAYPYPLAYREGGSMVSTDLLLQGKNPFDLSNNPQYMNVYGIFFNLLIFPFAKIWGPTILLHRIVTGFFLFACCLIIVAVLRKNKTPLLMSLAAGVMLYPFLLYPLTGASLLGPDSLGLFLFLMTFFVPHFLNYSKTSLIISLLFGLLAFYTKPYFLLGIGLTFSYIFLFKSKKNGTLYGLFFLIVSTLSICVVNRIMNCYFNNTVFAVANSAYLSTPYAIEQLKRFYQLQKPLFFLIGVYFIIQGVLAIKFFKNTPSKEPFSNINLFSWREPLLKWDFNINLYGLIITTLTIYFLLGRNRGSLEYIFELMYPFFILYVFNCLTKQRLITFVSMPLIIITLFIVSSKCTTDSHKFDENWEIVDGLIATHKNIFASPFLVPLLIKYHRPIYDSGYSEYFYAGADMEFYHFKFFSNPEVETRNAAYWNEIRAMVAQKKFDLLIMSSAHHPFMSDLYASFYRPVRAIKLHNFYYSYSSYYKNLVVWVPK